MAFVTRKIMTMEQQLFNKFQNIPELGKESGRIKVSSPSNIAIVKYWGKKGLQEPINPSISLTLKNCVTTTDLFWSLKKRESKKIDLRFSFEGKVNRKFAKRTEEYLGRLTEYFPILKYLKLEISSSNSFPHSSGIASSASSMSALSFALVSLLGEWYGKMEAEETKRLSSMVARIGSGSASRSLYSNFSLWGETDSFVGSSNLYAQKINNIHEYFTNVCDCICIVDPAVKSLSSSLEHQLMNEHHFKNQRVAVACERTTDLLQILEKGDWENFGRLLEIEALELHGLMMTSNPSTILLRPKSLEIIERIRDHRAKTNLPIYFTLDAGPNIHILYPQLIKTEATRFIKEKLFPVLKKPERFIFDEMGEGPQILESSFE
jgi:diphosphomevalonate decarboxylase